jgi:hypothetical protein
VPINRLRLVSPPKYAEPKAVKEAAKDWNDAILECRTYGHNWQPLRATYNARLLFYAVVQICPRCGTQRNMEIGSRGQVYASWYTYPEGYLLSGLGRITGDARDTLRMETITRTFSLTKLTAAEAREDLPHSSRTRTELGIEAANG